MRRYELTIITDGDITDDAQNSLLEKITGLIPDNKGLLVAKDDWGTKKLAYPIKKKDRGHYVFLDYCGTGALVKEMERLLRIDDRVLKYMTILLDDDIDLEHIREEMQLKEAAEKEAAEKKAEQKAAEQAVTQEVVPDKSESETKQQISDTPESEETKSETIQTEDKDKE